MKLATAGCSKRLGHVVRSHQIIQARNASYTSNPNTLYPLPPPGRPAPAPAPSSPARQTKQADSKPVVNNEIVSTLPKPRLDYRKIAETQKAVTLNHVIRNSPCPTDTVFHITRLYETSNSLHRKLDSVRAKQRDVGNLIKAGGGDEAIRQAKKLKLKVVEYEKILEETDKELLELGLMLPNETHPATPVGKEKEAIELEKFGPEPIPADKRRDHLDIALNWGWVDPAASATATGTSWPYLKGQLALLEQALIQYALSIAVKKGWTPVATPDVVKEDVMARCGFQPRDGAGQTYYLSTSPPDSDPDAPPPAGNQANLVLAATAEIPLAALSANKIIPFSSLPIKYVGVGKAFRAEAGARGADTRGLYRLHQFQKIELFAVTEGENKVSEVMMEEMREMQKEIYTSLGLSVRVLDMPTEELGAPAYRKYDMEAWMPGRDGWGEISSTSNCTDYQARRLHIRHRPRSDSTDTTIPFAHTLNGTCAAIPRLLVALLENGAMIGDDGKVVGLRLPKALERFWIGGQSIDGEAAIHWS